MTAISSVRMLNVSQRRLGFSSIGSERDVDVRYGEWLRFIQAYVCTHGTNTLSSVIAAADHA